MSDPNPNPDPGMATPSNSRMIPIWVQDQICSFRLAAYRSELRGESTSRSNMEPEPADLDPRPFGIPQEWQGAVEDVWKLIFEHVDNPTDIINLCEASDLFRRMLRRKYVEARFPQVLDICFRHKMKYFWEKEPWPRQMGLLFFLNVQVFFQTDAARNLRLKVRKLSKITKRAMENHLNSKGPGSWEPSGFSLPSIILTNNPEVDSLLRKLDEANIENDGTFFPTVLVVFPGIFGLDNLQTRISNVLQRIGRSIRKLLFYSEHDQVATYNFLRAWAELTPNLEELQIRSRSRHLELNVDGLPFPTLPKLKTYVDCPNFAVQFRERIIQACPNVRILIQKGEENNRSPTSGQNVFLPIDQLRGLRLEEWKCLSALPPNLLQSRFDWPLKRLTIIDINGREEDKISSEDLFGFVNTFQTLEHLHLELPVEDDGGNLELRNLRKFEWRIQQKFEEVDFILPVEKLENLHFLIEVEEHHQGVQIRTGASESRYNFTRENFQVQREEVLQVFHGLRLENFRGTNLKKFFPRLRSIKITKNRRAQTFTF